MSNRTNCHVVTGNLTSDGSVVYLDANRAWVPTLSQARAFDEKDSAEAELSSVAAQESIITDPYIFPAVHSGNGVEPASAREILRAKGPSTRIRRPDGDEQSPS